MIRVLTLLVAAAVATVPAAASEARRGRRIGRTELARISQEAIDAALEAGCRAERVRVPGAVSVPAGEVEAAAIVRTPARDADVAATVVLRVGEEEVRVALRADVVCPPPVLESGDRVRIVARAGPVVASAPGIAAQAGRIGETIRVTNTATRTSVVARVVDAGTVEVEM